MTSPRRSRAGTANPRAASERVIESYLAQVAAALPGAARARAAILAELRAGLLDAADGYHERGLTVLSAAEAAAEEFGDPATVAAALCPELAATQARRAAVTLLATVPLVVVVWTGAAFASHIGAHIAPPWQWAGAPSSWRIVLPLAGAALLVGVWMALVAIAATGQLTRWLPDRPRFAATAAAMAGFACVALDVILLLLLLHQLAGASGTLDTTPVAVAAIASTIRITVARRTARRCLSTRALLKSC
jgi:HAAS